MHSLARRDELLYESDAALRLVDRAIREMRVLDEHDDADLESLATDALGTSQDLNAAD